MSLSIPTLIFEPSVVQKAMKAGTTGTEVRRVTELTMTLSRRGGLKDLIYQVVADAEAGAGHDRAAESAAEETLQPAHASAALLVLGLLLVLRLLLVLGLLLILGRYGCGLDVVIDQRVDGLQQ